MLQIKSLTLGSYSSSLSSVMSCRQESQRRKPSPLNQRKEIAIRRFGNYSQKYASCGWRSSVRWSLMLAFKMLIERLKAQQVQVNSPVAY